MLDQERSARVRGWTPSSFGGLMWTVVLLLALSILALLFARTPANCTTEARAGISLRVVDSSTGAALPPGAAAAALDGHSIERLKSFGRVDNFAGLIERSGDFTLFVIHPGYKVWQAKIHIGHNACHVIPVRLTARLSRR